MLVLLGERGRLPSRREGLPEGAWTFLRAEAKLCSFAAFAPVVSPLIFG